MTRKELYNKITELNLQEEVKKVCGRNYTQAPNSVLESIILLEQELRKEESKTSKESEVTAKSLKCECQSKKQSSDETQLDKLIKVLTKKRVLLNSEVEFIMN